MQKIKFLSIAMVGFCLIGLLISVSPVKADDYCPEWKFQFGDFCWDFSNLDLETSGTLQLKFKRIGAFLNMDTPMAVNFFLSPDAALPTSIISIQENRDFMGTTNGNSRLIFYVF